MVTCRYLTIAILMGTLLSLVPRSRPQMFTWVKMVLSAVLYVAIIAYTYILENIHLSYYHNRETLQVMDWDLHKEVHQLLMVNLVLISFCHQAMLPLE